LRWWANRRAPRFDTKASPHPYFKSTIAELEAHFASAQNDVGILWSREHELALALDRNSAGRRWLERKAALLVTP
jgi:hypothetical protein